MLTQPAAEEALDMNLARPPEPLHLSSVICHHLSSITLTLSLAAAAYSCTPKASRSEIGQSVGRGCYSEDIVEDI